MTEEIGELVYRLHLLYSEIEKIRERMRGSKSNEYRRLYRKLRQEENEIRQRLDSISKEFVKNLSERVSEVIEKLKNEYDIYVTSIYYDYACDVLKDIEPELIRAKPIVVSISFHYFDPLDKNKKPKSFNDALDVLVEFAKKIREHLPNNVIVKLLFDTRYDHSETAYMVCKVKEELKLNNIILKCNIDLVIIC